MDGKIIKKLAELESITGARRSGMFIIEEHTGRITCEGREYSREEYEKIKDAPGSRIITIIDDIAKYICVWGDETTEPDSAFVAAWSEPEEEVRKNGSAKTGKSGKDTGAPGVSS
jgi:hypothetical protein